MTSYDHDFWEGLWTKTLREHGDKVSRRPPSVHLTDEARTLAPGRALDAGCGHGAETLWLAARGWRVTAVDFSAAALQHARLSADAAGKEIAERIQFEEGDLGSWVPEAGGYDLVFSLHVHVAGSVTAMVERLASGVAPGGTILLVGHSATDPATGAPTAAAGQRQVTVEEARAALDPLAWTVAYAEHRPRSTGGGVDAVLCARRGEERTGAEREAR